MTTTVTDEVFNAYVLAALWSSTDDDEPLDANYDAGDLADETRTRMMEDCELFIGKAAVWMSLAQGQLEDGSWKLPPIVSCSIWEYAGHDFWLTRNGHGVGFWDGDWPEGIGQALDRIAGEFGPYDLYVGDDGKIYGYPE
jgi:hypothetical protein